MTTHILFGLSSGASVKFALKLNDEQVVVMVDDLMWGPLGNVFLKDIQDLRIQWWSQVLNDEDILEDIPYLRDSYKKFTEWANALKDNDSLLFWIGDNPSEYTGLMCLLSYLPLSISVSVVLASKAYYKRYGKLKPRFMGEILPDKILPLMEDSKILSPRVREGYKQNWKRLIEDNGNLRILKNRQIETVPEDYFDEEILTRAKKISYEKMYYKSDGFLPAARLVGDVIGHQRQIIMDILIEWRIRCLIQKGLLSYKGSLTNMRLYIIKPIVD
jgi:hypothetical protein